MTDRRERALAEIQSAIDRTRSFTGWLFDMNVTPLEPGPPWDYESLAREQAAQARALVDLGTGGGERLAEILAGLPARAVALEEWVVNAPVARRRLAPLDVPVVRGSSLALPFGDEQFDLVLSRHEAFEPAEVARVLRPGGVLLTQQVDRSHLHELAYFLPTQDFGDHFTRYGDAFRAAGFGVSGQRHSHEVAYGSLADLVYLLLLVPWEVPGFDPVRDVDALLRLEDSLGTADGIVLTESYYLLTAVKPG